MARFHTASDLPLRTAAAAAAAASTPSAPSSAAAPPRQPSPASPLSGWPAFTPPPPPGVQTPESLCFVLTDMALRPPVQNTVCATCTGGLALDQRMYVRPVAGDGEAADDQTPPLFPCVVCAWKRGDVAAAAAPFMAFMDANPTVFHAVDFFRHKLAAAGFEELRARDDWTGRLRPGGRYYVTRNDSAMAAFAVGGAYRPGHGVALVAGHIDSLTARLKPVSHKPPAPAGPAGYVQLGVAPYAGALNETWWDRDLSIAGRVVVRDAATGATRTRLVRLGWPVAKIPTLAPHFGVSMTGTGNRETQMVPVIGLVGSSSGSEAEPETVGPAGSFVASQPARLVQLVAAELGLGPEAYGSIVNWELELFDGQPAALVGLNRELLSAGRIDDKICSWAAMMALLRAADNDASGVVRMVAVFDDEEIGSLMRQGAKSNFLPLTVERLVESLAGAAAGEAASAFGPGLMARTYAASFLVSADVTHAVHPNFLANYSAEHAPRLNVGVALVCDSNGHMPTDSVSTAVLDRVAARCGHTLQRFMVRNDSRSGGTIGPSISSALGIKGADAGVAQLGMHGIRATVGALDPGLGVQFYQGFLEHWEAVDAEWQ